MLSTKRPKRGGFTITEILIAVLLVLILSAIAVPRLLGNQRQADDTAAKGQLRTAAEVARNLMYESGNRFIVTTTGAVTGAGATGANATRLQKDEPNIEFVEGNTNSTVVQNRRTVSVHVPAGGGKWIAAVEGGKEGSATNCWFIELNTSGADRFGLQKAATTCNAANSSGASFQEYDFPPL